MSASGALVLRAPPELVDAVADRVLELMGERGLLEPDSWLTVQEAAEYMRCAPQRIYDLVRAGKLLPCRDGRKLLFRRSDLDRYLEGR
jgi:excisionase family DNA binding protein